MVDVHLFKSGMAVFKAALIGPKKTPDMEFFYVFKLKIVSQNALYIKKPKTLLELFNSEENSACNTSWKHKAAEEL